MTRLSVPGNHCLYCLTEVGEELVCSTCGIVDPPTVSPPNDVEGEARDGTVYYVAEGYHPLLTQTRQEERPLITTVRSETVGDVTRMDVFCRGVMSGSLSVRNKDHKSMLSRLFKGPYDTFRP